MAADVRIPLTWIEHEQIEYSLGTIGYGLPIMIACACTFKPVIDELIKFWQKLSGKDAQLEDTTGSYTVETIGRARQSPHGFDHGSERSSIENSMSTPSDDTELILVTHKVKAPTKDRIHDI